MSENKSRLTENDSILKSEIDGIIKSLNEKIFQAKKSGIDVSVNSAAKNDGTDDFYIAVYFTMSARL